MWQRQLETKTAGWNNSYNNQIILYNRIHKTISKFSIIILTDIRGVCVRTVYANEGIITAYLQA